MQISVFKYSAWKWSDVREQYYLHQFTEQQPDLNFNSTAVLNEMEVSVLLINTACFCQLIVYLL